MTTPSAPDLTVVTVNYNSGMHLLGCVEAVFANTRELTLEYFVVDNASRPDGTLETLRTRFPQVRVRMSERTSVSLRAATWRSSTLAAVTSSC